MGGRTLTDEDVELIARRTAEILRPTLLDPDPEFTREEAAAYVRLSTREFDRERNRVGDALAPSRPGRKMLFRRSRLDIYRASVAMRRRGRPPSS